MTVRYTLPVDAEYVIRSNFRGGGGDAVLPGLDRRKLSEMAQLTPSRWAGVRI